MSEVEFRNKVVWMTFILGVLVVMIHANNIELFMSPLTGGGLALAVGALEGLISAAAPTVAVPGFFMVSAYLFYRGVTWEKIPGKMSRRVGSVLVPYIAWTMLYYAAFSLAGNFPALWGITGRESVPFTMEGAVDAILNFTYNPVLWYLKQLIILVALAPFLYALLSGALRGGLFIAALLAVVAQGTIIPILNLDALLYYSVGAYLAKHARGLVEREDGVGYRALFVKAAASLAGIVVCVCLYRGIYRYGSVLMTVLFGICAPAVIWNVLPSKLPAARSYMKLGLFLYCFHFVPVRAINKVAALFLAHNEKSALLLYLALPVAVVSITWAVAAVLKKKIPPLWILLGGGR